MENRQTPADLVKKHRDQIDTLIAQVLAGVDAISQQHENFPKNYGYAGSLGHAVEQLNDLARFLGQPGILLPNKERR